MASVEFYSKYVWDNEVIEEARTYYLKSDPSKIYNSKEEAEKALEILKYFL